MHGFEGPDGIENSLPFVGRQAGRIEINHVGRESFGCNFKRRSGPSAVFKKEIHQRAATKYRHFADLALTNADKGFRSVQNFDQRLSRESVDREKMAEISVGVELDRGGHRSCISRLRGHPSLRRFMWASH